MLRKQEGEISWPGKADNELTGINYVHCLDETDKSSAASWKEV